MLGIFGKIDSPVTAYGGGDVFAGLLPFLNNILRLIFVISGLFGFFNLLIAGFGFMSAGGDPKGIEKAWNRIYQSLVGLIILVASFIFAGIFGYLLFGDVTAILQPKVWGPGVPGLGPGGSPIPVCPLGSICPVP